MNEPAAGGETGAEWLAANLPGVKVNLRTGFWLAWQSVRRVGLHRTASKAENGHALQIASACGIRFIH